jgi:hypothetical protein
LDVQRHVETLKHGKCLHQLWNIIRSLNDSFNVMRTYEVYENDDQDVKGGNAGSSLTFPKHGRERLLDVFLSVLIRCLPE